MRLARRLCSRAGALVALLATVDGCATAPAPGAASATAPVAVGAGVGRGAVYAEAVAAARQAGGAGRLREALWRWRIAEAVAPDAVASREAAAAQARLDAAVQSAEAEGARAASSGRTGEAQAAYMRALELDPGRPQARAFMRDALAAQTMADVGRLAGSTPRASEKRAHGGRRVKAARRRPGPKS